MRISDQGLAFIEREEGGIKTHAYQDIGGVWTIGCGRAHGVKPDEKCSVAEGQEWLKEDVVTAEGAIATYVTVDLNQNEYDALVDFIFNVGVEAFRDSTLRAVLNRGDYAGAAEQLLRWNHANHAVSSGLTLRREAERELFLTGNYAA